VKAVEATGAIAGYDEVLEVPSAPLMAVVVEALDGGVVDRAIHPLDLAVRRGRADAGEAVLDVMVERGPSDPRVGRPTKTRLRHLAMDLGLPPKRRATPLRLC
jgi:hypothetical protein